jgi:regulator of sigma E protease
MHDFVVTVVAFIVLIGLMVIVHEFGHFIVAKLCRVRVEAFSFGFGPRLFGFKHGDTDYKVCLLPLGGFVKMTGENPGEGDVSSDPDAFTSHPRWQRMLIGLAGPAANFVLAFVLMFIYFGFINEVPAVKPQLEWVTPGSTAEKAGFKAGDQIVSFGQLTHPDLGAVLLLADDAAGRTVPVTVERNGQTVAFDLPIPAASDGPESGTLGFPHITDKTLAMREVVSGSAAAEAGLHAGDRIIAVDGFAFHTLSPMVAYLSYGKGKPVTLTVLTPQGAQETLVVHPRQQGSAWVIGIAAEDYGDVPTRRAPLSMGKAAAHSTDLCVTGSKLIGQMLGKLLSHQASVKQLSGPVGIAVAAGEAAETKDWSSKFDLAAEISLNLGILNLLPFPILDGGMILFLLIESAIRRDISLVVKERIYQAAFVLIVVFFAFVIFNDVSNLPIFARFHQ